MSAIVYYLVAYPLSKCPLWLSYRFADFFYLLLITVFPYRKKVIESNLSRSFPNKTQAEINRLRRQFYRTFADMMIEGIKNIGISEHELLRRYKVLNPEIMKQLYDQGKSVLLVSAHYGNWEWMITSQSLWFPHQAVGIGTPLSNGFWNKKLNERRSRFGMHIIHSKLVNETFKTYQNSEIPIATLILSDQSPGDSLKSYWMEFLSQPTAVLFGAEQLANAFNQAVVFYIPRKIKRGYYEIELELLTDDPLQLEWGELTEIHAKKLEAALEKAPQHWLWSHKRWKRTVPDNLMQLKQQQREKFNRTFRSSAL